MPCAVPSNDGNGADGSQVDTRFYGRRTGRRLRPARRRLLTELLPRLRITDAVAQRPADAFPEPRDIWLEIGFGGGEHLAWQAAAHPEVGFIGCEPFVNGVASLLAHIEREDLTNVRVLDTDARPFLAALAPASIARAFILFPDPWPKRRHNQRRLVNRTTLDHLARALRPGAELRLASDDADYVAWMLRHVLDHPDFVWPARSPADWRRPPPDWPPTRYQQKTTARPGDIAFLRVFRR